MVTKPSVLHLNHSGYLSKADYTYFFFIKEDFLGYLSLKDVYPFTISNLKVKGLKTKVFFEERNSVEDFSPQFWSQMINKLLLSEM